MLHVNPDNIEHALAQSRANRGFTVATPWYAREACVNYDGGRKPIVQLAEPAGNTLGFGLMNGSASGLAAVWHGTAGTAGDPNGGQIEVDFKLTEQFCEYQSHLVALIQAGKSGTGTNADLAIDCEAVIGRPGTNPITVAAESFVLPATVAAGDMAELDTYRFDIGRLAKLSGFQSYLKVGSTLFLRIQPNEDPGGSLVLTVAGGEFQWNSHASLARGKPRGSR